MTLQTRTATPSDVEACGRIMFQAFQAIAQAHGFTPDFPAEEAATGLASALIANPAVFGVVAELNGKIVGSNFLSEADAIRGVGPITVAPGAQGRGVGRQLMQQVLGRGKDASGIRLLQDTFNMGSYGLYASLGFEVDHRRWPPRRGWRSRSSAPSCRRRPGRRARRPAAPAGRVRPPVHGAGRNRANFWIANHGVAASDDDLQALIAGAGEAADSVSFLLPTRQSKLFRWCLAQGLRAVKPMTLMTLGDYREPAGAYLPSVFY